MTPTCEECGSVLLHERRRPTCIYLRGSGSDLYQDIADEFYRRTGIRVDRTVAKRYFLLWNYTPKK